MFYFLDKQWELRGKTGELADLLSSMSLLSDGTPADNALWDDWLEAIRKVDEQGEEGAKLTIVKENK